MALLGYLAFAIALNLVAFVIAYRLRTDKLTDATYALSFLAIALIALLIHDATLFTFIALGGVIIWAVRLGSFLSIRIHRVGRDRRFDGIRDSFISFLGFWLLQGSAVWVLLLPVLFFVRIEEQAVLWFGAIVWLAGLLIESIADMQKYRFTADPKNAGRFMSEGLWRYSRHPNYFGEILCWSGLYLFVLPSLAYPQAAISLLSPLLITFLLIFVTGIPPLERSADVRWGREPAYGEYVRRTSILVPWFVRR